MEIAKRAVAGTMESSDIFVEVSPGGQGLQIEVQSVVYHQYGEAIALAVREVLGQFQVENAVVRVNDRGALDCTIRARVETALRRAEGGQK